MSFTRENLNQNYLDAFSELSFLYFGSESTDCRAWSDIFIIICRLVIQSRNFLFKSIDHYNLTLNLVSPEFRKWKNDKINDYSNIYLNISHECYANQGKGSTINLEPIKRSIINHAFPSTQPLPTNLGFQYEKLKGTINLIPYPSFET